MMSALSKVRVGVIGLGMGRTHLRNYLKSPRAEVVAVADLIEERREAAKQEFAVAKAYEHYEDLLADPEIDAVSVALPNALHAPVSIAAMKAGKHVLCEKPMAMNVAEAEEMAAVAKQTGRTFMMHFNSRFSKEAQWLKRHIDAGNLGRIYYARTGYIRQRGIPKLGGWFTNKAMSGGGPLIDLGVHQLDLTLWLMGHPKVERVSGMTFAELAPEIARRQGAHFDVEDLAVGIVHLEGGACILFETSWALNTGRKEEAFCVLYGTSAGVELRRVAGEPRTLLVHTDEGGEVRTWAPEDLPESETAQEHFVDSIYYGREPMATAEHGVNVMRVLDALYASAASGREVAAARE
mgnify:CR=1 FL=1